MSANIIIFQRIHLFWTNNPGEGRAKDRKVYVWVGTGTVIYTGMMDDDPILRMVESISPFISPFAHALGSINSSSNHHDKISLTIV